MGAAERRESIVRAAGTVFGRTGYSGTTTDRVARAAGISQPYVVRMFGTKEALFIEVLDRAERELLTAFRSALAEPDAPGGKALAERLGDAYVRLVADDGVHLPLMHAFLEGEDPVVGARARAGFLRIWRFLVDEAGFGEAEAVAFLGQGMLINVVLGLRLPADPDPEAQRLVTATCGADSELVRRHAR